MTNRYKQAGVDVTAGYKLVDKIKGMVASTKRSGYIGNIGSFGGLFDLDSLDYQHPILVSGTDGVGTKLMIAQKMHKNDSIGIDCVAMCVNDVLAQGAEPLFFLDYIATGHNDPDELASVVAGVAKGCRQANVSLIGGETAEMPGMYDKDKYDLAGFTVGVGEKETLISSKDPKAGDILLGLASSGVHSNGFSLIRQILFQDNDYQLDDRPDIFNGQTLGENLLTPTKIYVKSVIKLFKPQLVHGISHITGGGLYENVPRMFGDDLQAIINVGTWPELAIFSFLKKVGNLSQDDLLHTFNMGIGMVLAIAPENLKEVETILHESGEATYQIGYLRERPEAEEKILIQ